MGGKVVIVSGFSGSGKGTILERISSLHPEMEIIKSYTIRNKRQEGDFYTFVSKREFKELKEKGMFLECNMYSGEWYGTPRDAVEKCINEGRIAVIEVDKNGYMQIREAYLGDKVDVLGIYIVVDADTVINRLLHRNTENLEKILKRVKESVMESECVHLYDVVVPNYDIDTAVRFIENAIFHGERPSFSFDSVEYRNRMKHIIWLLE